MVINVKNNNIRRSLNDHYYFQQSGNVGESVQFTCLSPFADVPAFHAVLTSYGSLDQSINERVKFNNILINVGNG